MSTYLNEEQKKVFDGFNELLPWDKGSLLYKIAMNSDTGEIEKYFLDELGYIKYDDYDAVKDVVDNNLETEVLDEMDETEICDYLLNGWNAEENTRYMVDSLDCDDAAKMISELREDKILKIFDNIREGFPDTYKKILLHIGGIKN